jgi:hypothetical protein
VVYNVDTVIFYLGIRTGVAEKTMQLLKKGCSKIKDRVDVWINRVMRNEKGTIPAGS